MTKAEKARMEELETALALCWPSYPVPQPMTREEIQSSLVEVTPNDRSVYRHRTRVALGWFYNVYNAEVAKGWSDGMYHSPHNITGDGASQHMGRMYRSQREAAMALRHEMSLAYAKKLASVDRIIAGDTPSEGLSNNGK